MKITLIYKHEARTMNVPATLSGLYRQKLLSSADIVRECKKAYAQQLATSGEIIDISEIKGTLKK
jgi:hypothetical protein